QIMDAKDDVIGIGTLSKYPIRLTGEQLPLVWVGVPQVMALEWGNQTVHMVNFHMWATHIARAELLEENFRDREAQAAVLVKYVERVNGPVIVAGDANTTSLNTAYKILASSMADTWARAGFGMGHTFPGSDLPGSSRPRIGKWMAPQWFARIDYLFVSDDWVTTEAYLAPFDGVSDHRGVVARISLVRD
ncbi:MAG: hypothetical protein OEZ02_08245, partial [Anaerolineae bacterium]|nr:hypothetical protein [Anaerolineae bacterium]